MNSPYQLGRPAVRGAVAAATGLAVLLAGCGTMGAPRPSASGTQVTTARQGGPAAGSRAMALAVARGMLARLVLPPGSRRAQPRPVPSPLRAPAQVDGGTPSADVHRTSWLPLGMAAADAYLRSRVPAWYRLTTTGQESGPGGTELEIIGYTPRGLPRGVAVATLTAGVTPGPRGGSLLRADAQVIWFPPRTPAEELHPAAFRAVSVTRTAWNPVRTVTKTIVSRAEIAGLARLLNALPAATAGAVHCPAVSVSYRLAFLPRSARQPPVLVTAVGCGADGITVGGRAQPELRDPHERLAAEASRILAAAGGR